MQNRVHLITLGVRDMAVSRAYYEAMGWKMSPISMDEVTFYQAGGQVLGLYLQTALTTDTGLSAPAPGAITLAVNTHSREEVDAVFQQALKAGATALKEPQNAATSVTSKTPTDTRGNLPTCRSWCRTMRAI